MTDTTSKKSVHELAPDKVKDARPSGATEAKDGGKSSDVSAIVEKVKAAIPAPAETPRATA